MTLQIRLDDFCKKNKVSNKRNIFGAPDPEDVENLYNNEMNNERQSFEDKFPGMLKTIENIENRPRNRRVIDKAKRKLNVCLFGQPQSHDVYEMLDEVEIEERRKLREIYGYNVEEDEENRRQFSSNNSAKKRQRIGVNQCEENHHKKIKRRLIYPGKNNNNNNNNNNNKITDYFRQRKNGLSQSDTTNNKKEADLSCSTCI